MVCAETTDQVMHFDGVSVFAAADTETPIRLIDNAELILRPGEWLNIAGVNGSGKSTLARLLAGLHAEGVSGMIDRGFAGNAASPIVLQRPESQLFGETPWEEVLFALEWRQVPAEKIRELAEEALRRVGLMEFSDYPWDFLSGGQKQLAAVAAAAAAAMAGSSGLIVFDEATSMLDDFHRQIVIEMAREMKRQGIAIVWVTQRLDELEPEDRVVAMTDGRILHDGDVRSFFYGIDRHGLSPCEACGLRLPYLAALALELRNQGRLQDPLPVNDAEWRKVLGHADSAT